MGRSVAGPGTCSSYPRTENRLQSSRELGAWLSFKTSLFQTSLRSSREPGTWLSFKTSLFQTSLRSSREPGTWLSFKASLFQTSLQSSRELGAWLNFKASLFQTSLRSSRELGAWLSFKASLFQTSLRSRRKRRAWGVSPRTQSKLGTQPMKWAAAVCGPNRGQLVCVCSVARIRGLETAMLLNLGLTPQAYACACSAGSNQITS